MERKGSLGEVDLDQISKQGKEGVVERQEFGEGAHRDVDANDRSVSQMKKPIVAENDADEDQGRNDVVQSSLEQVVGHQVEGHESHFGELVSAIVFLGEQGHENESVGVHEKKEQNERGVSDGESDEGDVVTLEVEGDFLFVDDQQKEEGNEEDFVVAEEEDEAGDIGVVDPKEVFLLEFRLVSGLFDLQVLHHEEDVVD